ncbi:MAG: DUF4160 domain-containing protein [Turneriella sp.]
MPRIAFFFGISIYMYMDDHGVPHCHAVYGEYAGAFAISDGKLLAGQMPPAQTKKIQEFIQMNRTELMEKWNELSG